MEAVILAAGQGLRLQKSGHILPKGLLAFGEKPIIEESIEKVLRSGAKKVVIVAGYRRQDYGYLESKYSQVEIRINKLFSVLGSMSSLAVGLLGIERDCVVLDSDIIYDEAGLSKLVHSDFPNAILVAGLSGAGDEVWVSAEGSTVTSMSKVSAEHSAPLGEFVGITKLSCETLQSEFFTSGLALTALYEYEAFLDSLAKAHQLSACFEPGLVWTEIDDSHQLERARIEVYPRLSDLT